MRKKQFYPCRCIIIFGLIFLSYLLVACGSEDTDSSRSTEGVQTSKDTIDVTKQIGPEGGVVEITDTGNDIYGVKVIIPSGALSEETAITISNTSLPGELPYDHQTVGECIDFGPNGLRFNTSVELVLPYKDANNDGIYDGTEISLLDLKVMYFNDDKQHWETIENLQQRQNENAFSLSTNHFSHYLITEYIDRACRPDGEGNIPATISSGNYFFVLRFDYNLSQPIFKASVSFVVDLSANNATLLPVEEGNTATIDEAGYQKLFDKLNDATQWTWTWEIVTALTDLNQENGEINLEDTEVVATVTPTSEKLLTFTWNFNYSRMSPVEQLVVKFSGTMPCPNATTN